MTRPASTASSLMVSSHSVEYINCVICCSKVSKLDMKKVLVTGGCGYIGSHTIVNLIEHGFEVISVDNLVNSSEDILDGIQEITGKRVLNYKIDLCDADACRSIFSDHPDLTGVIHFAALKAVGESVEKPLLYFRNNLLSLNNVLENVREFGIPHIIFSSSCTVYGSPDELPVTEQSPVKKAESPYGLTKQFGEAMLESFLQQYNKHTGISLRYFNPAGAHTSAKIGESPMYQVVNLVPIITETAIGKRDTMFIHGDDYPTRDGTCVRDYIHVMDLARAHTLALKFLIDGKNESNPEIFNLGAGEGVTVMEAVKAFEKVSSISLNYTIGPKRAGDVPAVYSNFKKAREILGWQPEYSIEDIMRTAWAWERVR